MSNVTGTPITVRYARGKQREHTSSSQRGAPNGTAYAADGWISYDRSAKRWVYLAEERSATTGRDDAGLAENVLVLTACSTAATRGGKTTLKS